MSCELQIISDLELLLAEGHVVLPAAGEKSSEPLFELLEGAPGGDPVVNDLHRPLVAREGGVRAVAELV